jgi:hypothetical protein
MKGVIWYLAVLSNSVSGLRQSALSISFLLFALFVTAPALAASLSGIPATAEQISPLPENAEREELRFSLLGTQQANSLYWRISGNGKGEVGTSLIFGHLALPTLIADPLHHIAPSIHQFDIGQEGYRELRAFLALVIESKRKPETSLTPGLDCWGVEAIGGVEISWTDKGGGRLVLSNDCLNGLGILYRDRIWQSWHILARQMFAKGHQAVTIKNQVELSVPKKLKVTETGIWSPYSISWEIDAKGKGWIEFSQDLALPSLDPLHFPNHVRAGRTRFQLDRLFHQAVLREFQTILGGSARQGSCEDGLAATGEPLVEISWIDGSGAKHAHRNDLGCPSFGVRMARIKLLFSELLQNGRLGSAVVLTGKSKRSVSMNEEVVIDVSPAFRPSKRSFF